MKPSELLSELGSIHDKASATERKELAVKVSQLMESPLESAEHLHMAHAIVKTLADDVEQSVRQTLSTYLRSNPQLPKDVALQLANDIESIALPILESCDLINEEELLAIITQSGSAEKQIAIAKRDNVTENISMALVTHAKDDTVITTLLENQTAQISVTTMDAIVEKKADSEAVMQALVQRESVPIATLQKVTTNVSERIRDAMLARIQEKYGLSQHQFTTIADHSAAISLLKILDTRTSLFDARALVTNLVETRRMKPDIFMTALLLGKRHFVKYTISMLADEPFSTVEKVLALNDVSPKFEEMLDAAGLLPTFAMDIFWISKFIETEEVVGKDTHTTVRALHQHIAQHPDRFPNAQYFKMLLQSQPAFQD